jgi:hypothetical protein
MADGRSFDSNDLMLALAGFVVLFLVVVGALQLVVQHETGAFFRNLGVGVFLLAFSVAFYRKWDRQSSS